MVIFTEGVFILIYKAQSAKRIRIPRPPFLPTCCSSATGVSPMLSCSRLNRHLSGRGQSSCGGRLHVLTSMGRTKMLCYLARLRSCNRARESTRPQSRRLPIFNYIFIVLMYVIYIYSIIFYFFTGCARTQPLATRRGQRTVALALRERRAVGGSARRSAQAPTLHGKRAHRSAPS